ncbi:MAG TPA: response regulator [bacterium]|nr:response regulator [bacterium]
MKKILVVDDQKNVRTSICIGLGRDGYVVDVASNARTALIKLQETNYDIVLADVRMPDTNGFVLATVIQELYPHIKIILMSAYDFKDYEMKYEGVQTCPKLSKPFDMMELRALIGNNISKQKPNEIRN